MKNLPQQSPFGKLKKMVSFAKFLLCFILCSLTRSVELASVPEHQFDQVKVTSRLPVKSPGQGGNTGIAFDDVSAFNQTGVSPIVGIHSINVSYGDFVEAIQVTYILANDTLYEAPSQGRSSKPFVFIRFESIEHITELEGMTNSSVINQLTITTTGPDYEKRVYGPFGQPAPNLFSTKGYIIGFHGSSDNYLRNLGVYSLDEVKKSPLFGSGSGGSPFDGKADILIPPVVALASLTIWHGDLINGLQPEHLLFGGRKQLGEMYGGDNSSLSTTITFDTVEVIERVEVGTINKGADAISMLTITVRLKDGKTEVLGPYGRVEDDTVNFEGNVLGFYGYSGNLVDRLGFYYL